MEKKVLLGYQVSQPSTSEKNNTSPLSVLPLKTFGGLAELYFINPVSTSSRRPFFFFPLPHQPTYLPLTQLVCFFVVSRNLLVFNTRDSSVLCRFRLQYPFKLFSLFNSPQWVLIRTFLSVCCRSRVALQRSSTMPTFRVSS